MKKWSAILGALVLILVPMLLAMFSARHKYAVDLIPKVWPDKPYQVNFSVTAAPRTNTILLLGDSRIAEWGVPVLTAGPVLNAGFGGITTGQLLSCTSNILRQAQPRRVVIQAGINDLKLLGVRPGWREAIISNCVSNIAAVVHACQQVDAEVIVTTVWPVGRLSLERRVVWSGAVDPAVVETNRRLQSLLAGQPGVRVTDVMGKLTEGLTPDARLGLYRDTLHLKPETYQRLTAILGETLKSEK